MAKIICTEAAIDDKGYFSIQKSVSFLVGAFHAKSNSLAFTLSHSFHGCVAHQPSAKAKASYSLHHEIRVQILNIFSP